MRILATRLANYCLKGSVVSLYSHQSRSWCSSEGNDGGVEERTSRTPWKRLSAVEEEMKEMRRQMSMMMTKLEEVSMDKQGNHGEAEEIKEMRRQMSMMMTKLEEDSLEFRKPNTAQNPVDSPQESSPSEGKEKSKGTTTFEVGVIFALLLFMSPLLLHFPSPLAPLLMLFILCVALGRL
ncbi:PREDICTED: uncharacterized protein LOC104810092 [Tarenaya hassleriana]|uniref:uncharacterized protein LOC104810092 n=1 Tax=Tarenaya hassleriana TaxID=28532 RepID=UPI00053C667D|nr:PREDICTED: uncharacterized protein LOC104810092 [Tarenaya hassleriana]